MKGEDQDNLFAFNAIIASFLLVFERDLNVGLVESQNTISAKS